MALKSSEVRVAGTGELFLAPLNTAIPTDTTTALAAAYKGFGYTTEDGVVLAKSVEREGIPAWQSVTPVRYITTGLEFTAQATLLQSNADTVRLWLGSEAFTGAATDFKAELPVDPPTQQFVVVIEWKDGDIVSRLILHKAELTETGDVSLARAATGFPVTFGAIAPDSGTVLATWLTNDPAFDPTPALLAARGGEPQDDDQPQDVEPLDAEPDDDRPQGPSSLGAEPGEGPPRPADELVTVGGTPAPATRTRKA